MKQDDPLVAPFDTRAHFLVGHGQRGRQPASYLIIICESVAPLFRFRTQGIQSLRSIEGIVGITRLDQPQGVLQIDFLSFALPVGSVRTTFAYPFVGPDTAPLQGIEYVLLRSRHVTVRVGILDADDEVAAGPACEPDSCTMPFGHHPYAGGLSDSARNEPLPVSSSFVYRFYVTVIIFVSRAAPYLILYSRRMVMRAFLFLLEVLKLPPAENSSLVLAPVI